MNEENLTRKGNGPGRPKGKPNRTTTQMREILTQIVSDQLDNVYDALEEVRQEDKVQFLKLTQKFAEMVLPKQQEIAVTEAPTIDVEATIQQMKDTLSADAY